ncbi:MAG: hypothetical protein ACRDQA_19475 [Nocardioidaceae bacterium]
MRPEVILGFDPAPASQGRLAELSDGLRRVVRALVDARRGFDRFGRPGTVFEGAVGAPVATLLSTYARQLGTLEEGVVDALVALDAWRAGVGERQARVDKIVESVADTSGQPEAEDRRARLGAEAQELAAEHEAASRNLVVAFEELSACIARVTRGMHDLAGELDQALRALTAAVDEWVAAESAQLLRTAQSLGEVAGLTTVVSELVGVAALGRTPGEAEGVGEIIARSPGSHRLIRALRKQWVEVAPDHLPQATFVGTQSRGLADALSGRRAASPDEGAANPGGRGRLGSDADQSGSGE